MQQIRKSHSSTERLAVGLGCFSIGLGLAELMAPRAVARIAGLPDSEHARATLRAFGAREISQGVAILAQPANPAWIWARVGGDALDFAAFLRGASSQDADRTRALVAGVSLVGIAALDVLCAARLQSQERFGSRARRAGAGTAPVEVNRSVTVNRPIGEVYAFWRDFTNFPRFMQHLESVEVIGEGRSRWRAKAPAGMTVQWDAEIVSERENELLSWRSLPGARVPNSGTVTFEHAPGARGTEVHVHLRYTPPAGDAGRLIARLFGEEPSVQVRDDIRRFKQIVETGEVPLSDGPGMWRAAQPAKNPNTIRNLAGVER